MKQMEQYGGWRAEQLKVGQPGRIGRNVQLNHLTVLGTTAYYKEEDGKRLTC